MKTKQFFSLAALALMMAACSSDDIATGQSGAKVRTVPFKAVISADAGTRGLSEATDGNIITVNWEKDEQVALIQGLHIDILKVESVDGGDATISGDITDPTNGESVFVVYAGQNSKAMTDLKGALADYAKDQELTTYSEANINLILKNQFEAKVSGGALDGTVASISQFVDHRLGSGKLAISDNGASFKDNVKLATTYAIWKLSLSDGTNALKANELTIKNGDTKMAYFKSESGASDFYVPFASASEASFNFEAGVGEDTYAFSKTGVTLKAGTYYRSTVTMEKQEQQSEGEEEDDPEPETIAVTGVSLNKTTLSLETGGSETLTATIAPEGATDQTVTWSSDKEGVATVSSAGLVTAVAAGEATITVKTTDGGFTATCKVTVTDPVIAVTGVSLSKTTLSLETGGTATLTATVAPTGASDKTVTWRSKKEGVATVSSAGLVTAVAAGDATITVKTTDGGFTATCKVTVTDPVISVTGVTLNKTTLELETGGSETLTATVAPTDASDKTVTWSSNKESVATVDKDGKVTAVTAGEATITVKTTDGGFTATCKVTVTDPVTDPGIDAPDGYGEGGDPTK